MRCRLLTMLLVMLQQVEAARILMGGMTNGRSHLLTFLPLLHLLVDDGHNVTVTNEYYEKPTSSLGGEIEERIHILDGFPNPMHNDPQFANIMWTTSMRPAFIVFPNIAGSDACRYFQKEQPEVFTALLNSLEQYDLILVDALFSPCAYGYLAHSKKPYAFLHPTTIEPTTSYFKALGRSVGTAPNMLLRMAELPFDVNAFFSRLQSTIAAVEFQLAYLFLDHFIYRPTLAPFVTDFDWTTTVINSALHFTDMPEIIMQPEAIGNEIIPYGSVCNGAKTLPEEYERFVSHPQSKGTILIAFGTMGDWKIAPKFILEAFITVLNKLTDYRIIWSIKKLRPEMAKHVKLVDWVPQQELLADKRTILFISHGGLKSLKEAICSETPVIYLPLFAEQNVNAFNAKRLGFADMLNKLNLTVDQLEEKMREMLNSHPQRIAAVQRVRRLMLDQPIPQLRRALFWTRKLLKHGGNFRSWFYRRGQWMPVLFYFNCDLFVLMLSLCFVLSR